MWAQRSAPVRVRKPPEIFICSLALRWAYSAKLLVKVTAGSAMNNRQASRSAHRVRARLCGRGGVCWRGPALVVVQDRCQEGVFSRGRGLADGDRYRTAGGPASVADNVASLAQQPLHAGDPAVGLLRQLDNLILVAQPVGVASAVAVLRRQVPVGSETVVHGGARVRLPDSAAGLPDGSR